MNSLSTIIFVHYYMIYTIWFILCDLYYTTYLYISHERSLSLYSSLVDNPYSGSTFLLGRTVMLCTWGSIILHDDYIPRDLVTCLKKNQVIEEGVYFGSQLESVVYHENEVPAEKLETTSQITSLAMKHREMKTSSLLAFFLSPTLCPRYMKRCSSQLNCVVLPQFRSRKSLTGIQMFVSRSCRAEK